MGGLGVEVANAYLALQVKMPHAQRQIAEGLRSGSSAADAAGRDAGDRYAGSMERSLGSRAGNIFKRVAAAGITTIATIGAAAATVGVRTAAGMETANIAFTTMLGSGEAAQKMLGDLSRFAAKTPFDLPGLQRSAQSLISIGIDSAKVIPIMTTLGNVTAGMGTGAEGVQRATVAIQQMNAAGRITAEDLNQLRDAGIPVYDLLTAATGRSREELAYMAQNGKLGRQEMEQLMVALESGKGLERFNGMMEQQSQSLSGLWSTLKDTFSVGMAEAVQPMIPMLKDGLKGAIDLVGQSLPTIQSGMNWFASRGPAIEAGIKTAFGWLQENGPRIGAWIVDAKDAVAEFFANTFKGKDSSETFKSIGTSIQTLAPAIGDAARQMPDLNDAFTVTDSVLAFFADNASKLAQWMPIIIGGFVAWKVAQIANNVVGRDSIIGMGLQLSSTLALTASNRALATSLAASALAQNGTNVAENVGMATRIRLAAATLASNAATIAASVAARAAAAGQWLLNAAMTANPIGIVIAAIAAIVAALIWFFTQTKLGKEIWANAMNAIGSAMNWLWKQVIVPAWTNIQTVIGNAWNWIDRYVFSPFRAGIELLRIGFEVGARGIATAWDGIKRAAAVPINFVLETVWNNGIRAFWNGMVGTLGLSKDLRLPWAAPIRFADGSENHVAQIAQPGAWRLWAEPETGGEAYIPLAASKRGRSTAILADVAKRFGYNLSAYGDGGFFGDVVANIRKVVGGGMDFLANPAAAIQKHIVEGLIGPMMGGQGLFGQTIAAIASKTIKGLAGVFAAAAPSVSGGPALARVKAMLPAGLRITSTYRTPAENRAVGGAANSLHMNRANPAVDIAGSRAGMNAFALRLAKSGPWRELLYNNVSAPGIRYWPGHSDHIHAAAAGAIFPRLYDQGGWLPHGGVAMNLSGSPERVLSPEESADFDGRSRVSVTLVNPVVRDIMADAWDAAMVIGSVS